MEGITSLGLRYVILQSKPAKLSCYNVTGTFSQGQPTNLLNITSTLARYPRPSAGKLLSDTGFAFLQPTAKSKVYGALEDRYNIGTFTLFNRQSRHRHELWEHSKR